MLHILLTILKVTGIIIGLLLGIILLLIAMVLFVPVRYKAEGIYRDGAEGSFCVSWLLHLVRIKGKFNRDGPKYVFKVLWFTLRGNAKGNAKEKGRRKKKRRDETVIADGEDMASPAGPARSPEDPAERELPPDNKAEPETDDKKQKKENIFSKICGKIKNILKKITEKIKAIFGRIEHIRDKAEEIREFTGRKEVKEELKVIKEQTVKLLKHIFPTRLAVNARIGLGEPDKTGMTVGFISALCVITGKYINVTADFEQKILEADFKLRGRIRIFTVLMVLLKIYLQKNVVTYVKNFKL